MTELGKLVGMSQPAVTERVRRLEDKEVITQYRTVVSPEKAGKTTIAYILFQTKVCEKFIEFCSRSPHVFECHRVSGEYNYLLKVMTSSTQELESFENDCDKFGSSMTLIVLSSPIDYKSILPALPTDRITGTE
jgi:DNA-binding Lrp family transcriptional regulator